MIHLICGPIGAGKTTVAHIVSEKCGAIRFSEDEWLDRLFVADAPEGLLNEPVEDVTAWAAEKYHRCRGQIWKICDQLLEQRLSVVLDGAAANKEQRDLIRKKAKQYDVDFQLHYVTAEVETRRQRIIERNAEKSKTFSLKVTPEMFDMMEAFFEAPTTEELVGAQIIDNY
ncbi:ATP-binding protein [Motiliproteus sp. MSK22-1]|uniref:AAA family ATPase n=1 Tax=Motiliproteus sp. MSK22-1 TaxID=1897630 RepID=UPI00097856F3|nr:ATP-binding protein [Motiliproteus sp. MSK22-1]OMH36154.1 hypothetical protein BGP75_10410 [Motiliproteus sp. MSK22-1]